jgi:hypothetical protein
VDDLKNDLHWKDVEVTEMRDELDQLRAANKQLKATLLEEKHKRQTLESTKIKITWLKEL